MTDFEGRAAKAVNATSAAGAVGDPLADTGLRVEELAALATVIPDTVRDVAKNELEVLIYNATVQRGRKRPYVPMAAKVGTTAQGVGVILSGLGAYREAQGGKMSGAALLSIGSAALRTGSKIRREAYGKEYKKNSQ